MLYCEKQVIITKKIKQMKTCKDCRHCKEVDEGNIVMRCADEGLDTGFSTFEVDMCEGFEVAELKPLPKLSTFKARRQMLNMSLLIVEKGAGVAASTISRLENGKNVRYNEVKKIHDFYVSKGV